MIINHSYYLNYFLNNYLIMTLFVDTHTIILSYESHKYYNGNLDVSIAKYVKNQQLFMDLYAGIVMDV